MADHLTEVCGIDWGAPQKGHQMEVTAPHWQERAWGSVLMGGVRGQVQEVPEGSHQAWVDEG